MPENQNNPFQGKRIALVHDWLNGMRGGEKCLEVLCEIFPDATLFTLIHEQGRLSEKIEKMKISTSFIQKLPLGVSHYRHYLPIMPKAIESFDLTTLLELAELLFDTSMFLVRFFIDSTIFIPSLVLYYDLITIYFSFN